MWISAVQGWLEWALGVRGEGEQRSINPSLSIFVAYCADGLCNSDVFVQLELLAAKNLIAANLNGTSDPYALITCGEEKRFR